MKDTLDGQAVITRQKATGPAPNGGSEVQIGTVDMVLLADNRTVYACAYPGAECEFWADKPSSVVSHQATHSPERAARRLRAEKDSRAANYSSGARQGAAGRRQRRQYVIEGGLAATLLAEAEALEERAKVLRACAYRANQLEKADKPAVSAEELASLRESAQQLAQLRALLGKGAGK